MASFLNANLPSEDEEDDSYDPDADLPGNKSKSTAKKQRGPSRRGLAATVSTGPYQSATNAIEELADAKRKAKASTIFQSLKQSADARQNLSSTPLPAPALALAYKPPVAISAQSHRKTRPLDDSWMRSLGLAPPSKRPRNSDAIVAHILAGSMCHTNQRTAAPDTADYNSPPVATSEPSTAAGATQLGSGGSEAPPDGASAAVAAAAAEAERRAAIAAAAQEAVVAMKTGEYHSDPSKHIGMCTVVETRRFAGKDVEMARDVKVGSKEAENAQRTAAAAAASTGLDAVLHNISGPRKANVMDKSADDWKGFKSTNTDIQNELATHEKSANKFIEKQAFLKQAEASEYERQKAARQQAESLRAKAKP